LGVVKRLVFALFGRFSKGGFEKVSVFDMVFDGEFVVLAGHSVVLMCMGFGDEKYAKV
jgi:hypothetical protein